MRFPKCGWLFKRLEWPQRHTILRHSTGLFCLCGKCQGVIDIFLTAPFIFLACFRFYDLGPCWPLPMHSFLCFFFFFGGGWGGSPWKWLSRISMGCLSFETIFSSTSFVQSLWRQLFILRSNFSACCLISDLLPMLCPLWCGKVTLFLGREAGDMPMWLRSAARLCQMLYYYSKQGWNSFQ